MVRRISGVLCAEIVIMHDMLKQYVIGHGICWTVAFFSLVIKMKSKPLEVHEKKLYMHVTMDSERRYMFLCLRFVRCNREIIYQLRKKKFASLGYIYYEKYQAINLIKTQLLVLAFPAAYFNPQHPSMITLFLKRNLSPFP
jgi:hypothetical protein